jgi:ABC-type antimicrobial peptide transport system permease subunit
MLENFFKITLRNLWRNKVFSAINIAGLAIGMASAMLILLWVSHEISFDRFHEKTGRIYRLYSRDDYNGKPDLWGRVSSLIAPELRLHYPDVEEAVRINTVYFLVTVGEKHFNIPGAFADSGFLKLFSFPLVKGTVENSLRDNHSMVLTEKLAIKLFGKEDPMGKTVRIDSTDQFTVTGVLKDLPSNTDMDFEYLIPWSYMTRLGWDHDPSWAYTNTLTYVLLRPGVTESAFEARIRRITMDHVKTGEGSTRETLGNPLSREHLYSKSENGNLVDGEIVQVRMFVIIAVFILLIACINFMNLSTARSEKRAKEVGIRKVVGARKRSLIMQFIGESTLIALLAFLIALVIVQLGLTGFDSIVGIPLRIDLRSPYFWLSAIAFMLVTGLIAGSYPAFYLSSSRPVSVLKGNFRKVHALVTPRKILVVLQFSFAILLIICTMVVERQIEFARDRDAGYRSDHLIYTFTQGDMNLHYDLIKNDLLKSGAALGICKTFSPITRAWGTLSGYTWPGSTEADKKINFLQFETDADFVKTTGTTLVAGRDLDNKNYPTDSSALLLNESAVKIMNLKDPIGKTVRTDRGASRHIVGVVKDFIIESPYDNIEPMIISGPSRIFGVIHIRLNPANSMSDNLARAEKVFARYNPQYPFDYYFADEYYARKFKTEQQTGTLAALFAGLTILISCLGLFGLATYMAENRVKEIGVRKVLGASVAGIATMLSRDFLKLVMVSILIASPLAWLAMNKWLAGFTYRAPLSAWIFVLSGLLAIFIAILTVSFQAFRAAVANPVKSLRTE